MFAGVIIEFLSDNKPEVRGVEARLVLV